MRTANLLFRRSRRGASGIGSACPMLAGFAALLLAAVAIWLTAARQASAGDNWLPISPADLALKDNPAEPGADAMILYRDSKVNAKYVNSHGDTISEYVRIKIFTQNGLKYANVEIPYATGNGNGWVPVEIEGNDVQIVDVHGRTIHPDGTISDFKGKVLDKMVEKEHGYKIREATFSLPDVQPGCIIEYRYTKAGQPRWLHSEYWDVSEEIFTREAHFTFVPDQEYDGFMPRYRFSNIAPGSQPKCGIGVDQMCQMTMQNIPAVIKEPLMPPPHAISSYVEWYYADLSQPVNQPPQQFWNHTAKKWASELDKFAGKKDALRDEVSRITSPSDSPESKLRKIYARVQQIRNLDVEPAKSKQENKAEEIKKNSNVKDVLSHGYGNGWQLNAVFIAFARAAGFDADEVRVGPTSWVYFSPQREDPEELGAIVSWVKAGSQEYWLDPASPTYPFGLLPWEESAAAGIRVSNQGGEVVTSAVPDSKQAVITRRGDFQIDADGTLHGTLDVSFAGQEGATRRRTGINQDDTGRKKAIEDEIKGWLPTVASFDLKQLSNWSDADKPLEAEGSLRIPGFASALGRRMLVPAAFFSVPEAGELASETRANPLYFDYPYERVDDLKFEPPAGYKIEGLPQDQKTDLKALLYEISCVQDGDAVETKRQLIVNALLLDKKFYPTVRAFFGIAKSTDAEQAVLESAQSAQVQ